MRSICSHERICFFTKSTTALLNNRTLQKRDTHFNNVKKINLVQPEVIISLVLYVENIVVFMFFFMSRFSCMQYIVKTGISISLVPLKSPVSVTHCSQS